LHGTQKRTESFQYGPDAQERGIERAHDHWFRTYVYPPEQKKTRPQRIRKEEPHRTKEEVVSGTNITARQAKKRILRKHEEVIIGFGEET